MTELMGGNRFHRKWLLTMLCAVTGLTSQANAQETSTADSWAKEHSAADADRLFTLKVLPLLTEKCFGCHGNDADDIKGEYLMLNRTALLRGGESEEIAVHPGKADQGTLLEAISMHEGEAVGTRDRFLQLPHQDREAVIAFLETLVAPPNVPQPPM